MDEVSIAVAIAQGLSPICATCSHFIQARAKGSENCGRATCGGPLKGRDFPSYKGPMGLLQFRQWCFVCAAESSFAVRVAQSSSLKDGSYRLLGVCREHLHILGNVDPAIAATGEVPRLLVRTPDGVEKPVIRFLPKPRKTLREFIDEVESYYAAKEGREHPCSSSTQR